MLLHRQIALLSLLLPVTNARLRARAGNATSIVSIKTTRIASATPENLPAPKVSLGSFLAEPLNILIANVVTDDRYELESLTIISSAPPSSNKPLSPPIEPVPSTPKQPVPAPSTQLVPAPIPTTLATQIVPTSLLTKTAPPVGIAPTVNPVPIPPSTAAPDKPAPTKPPVEPPTVGPPPAGPTTTPIRALSQPAPQPSGPQPSDTQPPTPQPSAPSAPSSGKANPTPLPIQGVINAPSFDTDTQPGDLPPTFAGPGGSSSGGSTTGGSGSGSSTGSNIPNEASGEDGTPASGGSPGEDTTSGGRGGSFPVGGIIGAVIAVVAVAFTGWVVIRRKKRGKVTRGTEKTTTWIARVTLMVGGAWFKVKRWGRGLWRVRRRPRASRLDWDMMGGGQVLGSECGDGGGEKVGGEGGKY
ncbi:hypothetical protein QBC39DRAFT_380414 [Podospora conica]|nr:hypothetical protein QBC39DRAFT_380414 [Schizothecium conicum]